ncbi:MULTISPECIES: maleate cis-trans isomerase family protein [Pseudonocardia]|uniref:Maleate isomerase n=2 Tax=Pseudonocardia TaxID=1847 RepID=A0A1Y2MLE0_PSEAH|nr:MULTISPECIES: maleate cis-trans isomerase [Pseudonocardia]OSY35477.1 Maleate isomerase [Pseudonocardia autotrophica]TDN76953.1 maleate isomerase [Pseudonocardia autotrophica]BBG00957.1 maleate isomerase [Pseudonocardia autotrophica]GEC29166.1 maleate isomerase [Pseudonocardia saturnea]
MTTAVRRIGLVVPSSNVTVETEIPALLARHSTARFSFHSSRMRMHTVSPEELRAMNAQRERCIDELADAGVDALLYACLVALMAQGPGEHRRAESAVTEQLAAAGQSPAVRSSAGALVEALSALGARRIVLVTPYLRPLAEQVVGYLEAEGFEVADFAALEVGDNAAVGAIPGERVLAAARGLDRSTADALVISACVQMPSLDLVAPAEREFGLPVLSAATAGAYSLLRALGEPPVLPGAGSLLDPVGGAPHLYDRAP